MPDTLSKQTLGQRLLALRESRKLSLRTLAEKVGLSASFLSQIERDEASPSIASLEKIAQALNVDRADLFVQAHADPVVRASERGALESAWSKARLESLSRVEGALHPRLLTLRPGGGTGFLPSGRGETFLFELKARLVGREVTLRSGDALHALPDHQLLELANPSSGPAVILVVSTNGG